MSATDKRARLKGRRDKRGSFSLFPHECGASDNYTGLSAHAIRLLHDLLHQYRGRNNGDLSMHWSLMRSRGWRSRGTLAVARRELLERGWIVQTLHGGRRKPSLYALTWLAIDDCGGKLEVRPQGAPGFWKQGRNPWPTRTGAVNGISLPRPACETSTHSVREPEPLARLACVSAPNSPQNDPIH
jgi:hypothetical protein